MARRPWLFSETSSSSPKQLVYFEVRARCLEMANNSTHGHPLEDVLDNGFACLFGRDPACLIRKPLPHGWSLCLLFEFESGHQVIVRSTCRRTDRCRLAPVPPALCLPSVAVARAFSIALLPHASRLVACRYADEGSAGAGACLLGLTPCRGS